MAIFGVGVFTLCRGRLREEVFRIIGGLIDYTLRNRVIGHHSKAGLGETLAEGFRESGFVRFPEVITDGFDFDCGHGHFIARVCGGWQRISTESSAFEVDRLDSDGNGDINTIANVQSFCLSDGFLDRQEICATFLIRKERGAPFRLS